MRHGIWEFPNGLFTAKSNSTNLNKKLFRIVLSLGVLSGILAVPVSCGVYSFSGGTTNAETISIADFYNNADLGPANMGQDFTNLLKNYIVQNSSLSVTPEEGELQMEGEISNYTFTQIAPTAPADPNENYLASSTRLTITVRVTYVNTLDETMSFKDKSFSFYKDFSNDENISDVEEAYVRQIFDRIVNDIFNASIANW
jgi:hypothetical protein